VIPRQHKAKKESRRNPFWYKSVAALIFPKNNGRQKLPNPSLEGRGEIMTGGTWHLVKEAR
jgi:hypothetical protein